jgi:hypothetical protein
MTADTQAPQAEVGQARPRKEDARLVTGQTNWTDNIVLPGMLHMSFVRSPMAHARITSVDLSAARAMPGVIAAFSGADFAEEQGSLPCAWPVTEDIVIPAHPPMATDEVRYVGEAVAVVIARDRYTASDAMTAVDVSYEPLPPVLDIRTALDEGSPKVHEQPVGDVVQDGLVLGQEVLLEHKPKLGCPQPSQLLIGQGGYVQPRHPDPPAAGPVQGPGHVQQGGLARPGRPEHAHQIPRRHLKAHPPQRGHGRKPGMGLGYLVQLQHQPCGAAGAGPGLGVLRLRTHRPGTTTCCPGARLPVTCTSPAASSNRPGVTVTR